MSEHPPDPAPAVGARPAQPARPAPPAYGPVYGKVARFGQAPPAPSSPAPPAPAPAPTASAPPAPPSWSGPPPWSGAQPWAAPPPWAGPTSPPWSGPPPWVPAPPVRRNDYARWSRRVLGTVVDQAPSWVALVVLYAGYLPLYLGLFRGQLDVAPRYSLVTVGSLLSLAAFGWSVYNRYFLAGRTGQSVGKRVARTWLVSQDTGRPIGPLNAFTRDLLHILDGLGYVGYLWPLWDDERQTLADKIARTVVVRTPVAPLPRPVRRP